MYNIRIHNIKDSYDYNELIKIFLPPEAYRLCEWDLPSDSSEQDVIDINLEGLSDKNAVKREIFLKLSALTGKRPPWGILTGVRPVKLIRELTAGLGSAGKARSTLTEDYFLSNEKADLLMNIYGYQQEVLEKTPERSVGMYIGIPFCPTRCLYCSFTSNQTGPEEIEEYLAALFKEISCCGRAMKEKDMWAESIYIGGGTPTTLTAHQLELLLSKIKACFDLARVKEFTVEAGRPDTITEEKLKVIADHGIERISINPQTMKDQTLKLIGRSHSVEDIRKAFDTAKSAGDFIINADLIAGLPGETAEDFENTLTEVIGLLPANITVHTLAVKKASRLIEADENYHYKQGRTVEKMIGKASEILAESGYRPYYLYRQKHMAGALENIGYCKDSTPCIYNMRIMDENQSILALGAGGISKKYYPQENRLERVPNVSNYRIYIERLDEMIKRKSENFF